MGRFVFQEGPFIEAQISDGPALISVGFENLWTSATFLPIFADDPKRCKIYSIRAGGIMSTGGSGTLEFSSSFQGITLDSSSQVVTVPINMTNVPWIFRYDLMFRTIGASGNNSACIGSGQFTTCPFTSSPAAGKSCVIPIGGTQVSVNAKAAGSLSIVKRLTVAGRMMVQWSYLNALN